MITQIYIKNFKAFERQNIIINKHNIIIGENDSGKSSLLEALNIFFNYNENDKIDKNLIRNLKENVEIGMWFNDKFYKKIYSPSTFKLSNTIGNFNELSQIRYIYIPVMNYAPKQLITQLAISKVLDNTETDLITRLKKISQESVDKVIDSIDENLLIINNDKTTLIGTEQFKYEGAIKFNISSNDIPVESRGSGFQKNLMYALLIGNKYNNVILGIDEIENSLSINNCNSLIVNIQKSINQTLITTHSKEMLKIKGESFIIPIYNGKYKTLGDLLSSLDEHDTKTFLLVEGKYDLPWFKRVINILEKNDEYILLPSGGSECADHLKMALTEAGKRCLIIRDGDTNTEGSLNRDCIELYVPLEYYKKAFGLNSLFVPDNKKDFFDETTSPDMNEDSVKKFLSNHVDEFLDKDNPLIDEVSLLLSKNNDKA